MIKLYLAEDQQLLNTALTMILNLETDFEVIGSATDGDTALSDIIKLKPNIVLLDIEMPKLTGLEIAKQASFIETGCENYGSDYLCARTLFSASFTEQCQRLYAKR